jgi:hypothetical protein
MSKQSLYVLIQLYKNEKRLYQEFKPSSKILSRYSKKTVRSDYYGIVKIYG